MENGDPADLSISWWDLASPVSVSNNGHTVQIDVAGNAMGPSNFVVYKGKKYQFLQFHFHGCVTPCIHRLT